MANVTHSRGFSLVSVLIGLSLMSALSLMVSKVTLDAQKQQRSTMLLNDLSQTYSTVSNIINTKTLCDHSGLISTSVDPTNPDGTAVTLHYPENNAVGSIFLKEGDQIPGSQITVNSLKLKGLSLAGPAPSAGQSIYLGKLQAQFQKPADSLGQQTVAKDFSMQVILDDSTHEITECVGVEEAKMPCDWTGARASPGQMGAVCQNGKVVKLSMNLFEAGSCSIVFPKGYQVTLVSNSDGTASVTAAQTGAENHNEWVGTITNAREDTFKNHTCPAGDAAAAAGSPGWDSHCFTAPLNSMDNNFNNHSIELTFNTETLSWKLVARGKTNNYSNPRYTAKTCTAGGVSTTP